MSQPAKSTRSVKRTVYEVHPKRGPLLFIPVALVAAGYLAETTTIYPASHSGHMNLPETATSVVFLLVTWLFFRFGVKVTRTEY